KRGEKIMKVAKSGNPDSLPPEGKMLGGSECTECPYARSCLGFRPYSEDDPKALPKKKVAKLEIMMATVKGLEAEAKKAEETHLEAKADLFLAMQAEKRNFVKGTKYYAHAKGTAPQERNDVKKLIALAKSKGATAEELAECKSLTKPGSSF